MPPKPEPELPPEVLDRLAGCERVSLQVGLLGSNALIPAIAVPLRGALYILFVPTSAARATMEHTVVATVQVEAPDASWSISARGRLLHGRTAQADSRRSELAHWVPEGEAARWTAGHFYAEHLDYQVETPQGRRRATGPLPGCAPRSWWRLVNELAIEPFQWWFLASGVMIAIGILYADADEAGTPLVLVLALLAAALPVVAGRLVLAPLDLERWRDGREVDASLGELARAWVSPAEYRTGGLKLAAVAAVVWVLLVLLGGPLVAALVSLLSGAPVLLLIMAVRRRSGAKGEA
ncbi:MAG: hypothetical protein EXR71_17260 [Myxococcales bacterium]|nr:hypothetical protein [Myxococcales bacterium]